MISELREKHKAEIGDLHADIDLLNLQNEDLQTRLQDIPEDEEEVAEEPRDVEADGLIADLADFAGLEPPRAAMPSGGAPAEQPTVPRMVKPSGNAPTDSDGWATATGRTPKSPGPPKQPDETQPPTYEEFDPETNTTFIRKTVELDKIAVPAFPGINQLMNYRVELATALATAGGRFDCKEIGWFDEIMLKGQTFEALADSGPVRFNSLDIKLGMQLIPTIKSKSNEVRQLYDDVLLKQRNAVENGCLLKGRQVVFLIHDYYRCNANLEMIFTVEHLAALSFDGDKTLHTFMHNWNNIIAHMKDKFSDDTLRDMLERKIYKSKELSEDIAHYNRQAEGAEHKTYKFLMESIVRAIGRQQMLRNRQGRDDLVKKGGGDSNAFPGPPRHGQSRGREEGQSQSQSQGESQG